MNNIFFGIITLSIIVISWVLICVLIEIKKTAKKATNFLQTTETSLDQTLEEVRNTLKSIRNFSDGVTAITDDVKVLSSSVREAGINIRDISRIINSLAKTSTSRFSGIRAALKAGSAVLIAGLIRRIKHRA